MISVRLASKCPFVAKTLMFWFPWTLQIRYLSNFGWWYCWLSSIHLYHSQWHWLYFKVTAVSSSYSLKFYVPIRLSWDFVLYLITSSRSWIYHYFLFSRMFKGDNWHVSSCGKKLTLAFSQTPHFSKIFQTLHDCNLDWGLTDILGLITLNFQGQRCARNMNCKLHVLDSCAL